MGFKRRGEEGVIRGYFIQSWGTAQGRGILVNVSDGGYLTDWMDGYYWLLERVRLIKIPQGDFSGKGVSL